MKLSQKVRHHVFSETQCSRDILFRRLHDDIKTEVLIYNPLWITSLTINLVVMNTKINKQTQQN